ncbi:MAG: hypothetical protein QOF63_2278 [Thermoanaerobaculia bacterium]|jgi:hypothetical protein|nr:hypothetical protein [Thermoanaerobaculia bacterium]MEA2417318.1 hypothetical protein [Thermoanaerobaculia bacterium]
MNTIAVLLCVVVSVPSIPDVIARFRPGPPVWVAARSAFNSGGDFRDDVFIPLAMEHLDKSRRQNADRCNQFVGAPPLEDFTPKDSLDALAAYSLTIIKAHVIAGDEGFDNGEPGILFALRLDESYKSIGHAAAKGPLYLFIGEAIIPTAKGLICSKAFTTLPLPAVGDDVIVFCSVEPIDDEQRILHIEASQQLVLQHGDHVYLPRLIKSPAPANIDDLGGLIRANPHLHESHAGVF